MAYVITVIEYQPGNPMPSGSITRAVSSLNKDEIAAALFNWREGDRLTRREQRIIDVILGQAFNPICDGSVITVEQVDHLTLGRRMDLTAREASATGLNQLITEFNVEHS